MAHGAGGKATQTLIEGLLAPAFGSRDAERDGRRRRRSPSTDVELAFTTDSYVVKPLRFPGGSIGELAVNGTVNDLAVSGARPLALSLSLILEEGLRADELRPRSRRSREPRAAAGVRDRHRRHQGRRARARRRHVRVHDRHRPSRPARPSVAGRRSGPGTGSCCRGASASTARRSCSRAASSSSTPRSSPTRGRCGRPSTRCSRPPGPSCAACATRPAAASRRC